ncbi:MAG: tetratricopeptide repeat protein [Ignavibacteriaceae bacterium]
MKQISIFLFAISFLMLSGCTKKTDNYYINEAAKALSINNFTLAVSAYDKLISEYPNSPKAPFALFQTATFYQNKQVKQDNLTDTKSFEEAVARFRRLFDSYPNDRLSSRALFMSGFIQANDLKQYSQAAATFNLFLKKYPDNELVVSVKEELNNMGLSPEEIIQRKESSVKNVSPKQ